MKFSTIILALATVVAPFAAKYICHTEAIFTYASDDTPSISTEAQEFLGSVMVDTFNEAYVIKVIEDDATATCELGNTRGACKLWTNTRSNHCGPTCSNDNNSRMLSSEVPAGVRMLWTNTRSNHCGPTCSNDDDLCILTSSEVVPAGDHMLWTNTCSNHCGPTCSNDDDSRMLTSSEVVPGDLQLWTNASHGSGSFTDAFGDALKHATWDKFFLEKGRTHTELAGLKGATIVLSDCHIE